MSLSHGHYREGASGHGTYDAIVTGDSAMVTIAMSRSRGWGRSRYSCRDCARDCAKVYACMKVVILFAHGLYGKSYVYFLVHEDLDGVYNVPIWEVPLAVRVGCLDLSGSHLGFLLGPGIFGEIEKEHFEVIVTPTLI
ncbi:hypothetical protein L6452_22530 [Arctium lappa]|uniref:Uncharacterized protein n=1 Tax=Arctium lappa TaxID=4217 RepID=A0ACB9AZ73_ARCLA|nr:hypothetical protein L6452_22530 [Arctium lappa]